MARKEKKFHFIYKTTNILNGKYYIGMHSTNDLNDGYMGSGKRLRYSINKHGKDNHVVEILEYLDNSEQLKLREEEIVNLNEIAKKDCMNLMVGGKGGVYTMEHLKSISKYGNEAFIKRLNNDEELKEKYRKIGGDTWRKLYKEGRVKHDGFKGKKHSEETKKRLSESRKGVYGVGKNNSCYGSKWMNKNGVKKMVKKIDIEEYVKMGWLFGQK